MRIEPDWKSSSKIVVCNYCSGTGIVERSELTDYHRNDYDYWNELCKTCGGEGRRVQIDYSFRVEYSTPDNKHSWPDAHKDHMHVVHERLDGRRTEDIYKIG